MADYGTTTEVEALTRRYTNGGKFDTQSNPTNTQVDNWLDQLSSVLNTLLAGEGFAIPIADGIVKPMIDAIAVGYTRDLVEYANSAGRFYEDKTLKGGNVLNWITKDLIEWVDMTANGMEAAGATRTRTLLSGIFTKWRNSDGDIIEPLFNESDFGVPRPTS